VEGREGKKESRRRRRRGRKREKTFGEKERLISGGHDRDRGRQAVDVQDERASSTSLCRRGGGGIAIWSQMAIEFQIACNGCKSSDKQWGAIPRAPFSGLAGFCSLETKTGIDPKSFSQFPHPDAATDRPTGEQSAVRKTGNSVREKYFLDALSPPLSRRARVCGRTACSSRLFPRERRRESLLPRKTNFSEGTLLSGAAARESRPYAPRSLADSATPLPPSQPSITSPGLKGKACLLGEAGTSTV